MTTVQDVIDWRNGHGFSRPEAAGVFGVPVRTLERLEQGGAARSALLGPIGRIMRLHDEVMIAWRAAAEKAPTAEAAGGSV